MSILTLYISSDNVLTLVGLNDTVANTYLNSASVSVTLKDSSGNNVSGETWPLAMAYVASSNGNYRATLTDSLILTDAANYTAEVVADAGAGLKRTFKVPIKADWSK